MRPPPLNNDCFALPRGVAWTPVEEALERLRTALHPIAASETVPLASACGRFLASGVTARRANPPVANCAVDGYAFALAGAGQAGGAALLPLVDGRAAAGMPHDDAVPKGHAVRILTGAALPEGVDTVVLDEDVNSDGRCIAFHNALKRGANTRLAGEDFGEGDPLLPEGHRLRPQDLALLAAAGLAQVPVRRPLKVGILSTGDEIRSPGEPAAPHEIYDANRPMLLALVNRWCYDAVDIGHVGDDRAVLRARLEAAATRVDAILTTGGASAGEEDHVSALLGQAGTINVWRIALKPGRPLALGLWQGTPVFGLPGNPVAAFVCALIFCEPALRTLAGGAWRLPAGRTVPAGFAKTKRPGRREYLRARLGADGRAEVFRSEGSGRVSSLSWSTGLVALPDGALTIAPGDPVEFLPYEAFGL